MDSIRITGGVPLHGTIAISGAKNAALPLMTCGLLTDERLVLSNVAKLADLATMAELLGQHGIAVEPREAARSPWRAHHQHRSALRHRAQNARLHPGARPAAGARAGEARVSLPGGCAIGTRPVDLHLKGLEAMGAVIKLDGGYIDATAPQGLHGARRSSSPSSPSAPPKTC